MKKMIGVLGLVVMLFGNVLTTFAGEWKHSQYGWWYDNGNGNYPTNRWQQINGEWYYFNESGYMQTGLQFVSGKWYYCWENGTMAHDTWVNDNHYFGSDGVMLVNTTTPDGSSVDDNGYKTNNLLHFRPDGIQFVDMGEYYIVKGALGRYEPFDKYDGVEFKSHYEGDIYISKNALFHYDGYINDEFVSKEVDLLEYFKICEYEQKYDQYSIVEIEVEFGVDGYIIRGNIYIKC